MEQLKKVTIYTDGGCRPNPGPGGYGVVLKYGKHRKEISGGYRLTTNNRMEIMAAIAGLEALNTRCEVTLYSDSQYLVDAMMKGWVRRWQAQGWQRTRTEKARNPDLWARLLAAAERHRVTFVWVKGHAGIAENERCDELATVAIALSDLPADEVYEQTLLQDAETVDTDTFNSL